MVEFTVRERNDKCQRRGKAPATSATPLDVPSGAVESMSTLGRLTPARLPSAISMSDRRGCCFGQDDRMTGCLLGLTHLPEDRGRFDHGSQGFHGWRGLEWTVPSRSITRLAGVPPCQFQSRLSVSSVVRTAFSRLTPTAVWFNRRHKWGVATQLGSTSVCA